MRPDIAKLTTEAPRRGGYPAKKYGGKVRIVHNPDHDYENEHGGFHSSSRRGIAHGHDHKEFSDVLGPLRGALRKNVGRPWNDVYSEFCQFLDRRSMAGIHIFSHLVGFRGSSRGGEVRVNGLFVGEDGKVYEYPSGGFFTKGVYPNGTKFKASEVNGFYVHPVTGILCYKKRNYSYHGYHRKALIESLRKGNSVEINNHKYETINGIWFETWYVDGVKEDWQPCWLKNATAEDHARHSWRICVQHSKTGEWGTWRLTKTKVIDRKRSLNSKEIKMVKKYIARRLEELGA